MKLNKEVCKKCSEMGWKCEWDDYDEIIWRKGHVKCPKKFFDSLWGYGARVNRKPPKHCPYKVEHLLIKNEEKP